MKNIMLIGITGTGKSTLINAVMDENSAFTSRGIPKYYNENLNIGLIDTGGLEISEDGKCTAETFYNMYNLVYENSRNITDFDCIHAVWYLVNAQGKRLKNPEADFISQINKLGVPIIIVMTQCLDEDEDNEFQSNIRNMLRKYGTLNIPIVQVLALEKKIKVPGMKEPVVIPTKGLKELFTITHAFL